MSYTGRCACDTVQLTITGTPVGVRQCWCRQCQQIAAGGPTNNAIFSADDVAIVGSLGSHAYIAPSGNTLTQYFCTSCGNPVYAQSSARLHLKTVRLGVINLPHDLKPTAAIWISEAPGWAVIDPALEQFTGQPPAPQSQPSA
jgi:hypothetical protein